MFLQRQRVRALLATTEPLGLQRSATKSPKPIFNEVKGESRMEKQRSLVATLCRDDKHTIIFTLLSTKPSTDPLPYGTPPNLEGEFLVSKLSSFLSHL